MNCVDLFAGAGGFSLAAKQAGLDVRLAVELNRYAVETYRFNLCSANGSATTIYNDDITTLSPKTLFARHFGDDGICDLMLGGPPCQGFSSHRLRDAGVSDPRNELIHTYFDFVDIFRPSYFLMENVPGMLWPRHRKYLEDFYAVGEMAGYRVYDPIVLDARDYGVPQRRKRVFILGVLSEFADAELSWPPRKSHGPEGDVGNDPDLIPWRSCKHVFGPAPKSDPNDIHMVHGEALTHAFAKTPANGGSRRDSGRVLPCHETHTGHKDVYGRINPFLAAPTMTTACFNPSKGRFVHPTENHGITLRQAARIQTFPDDFVFMGGLTPAGKQIGNAVPIVLGRALVDHLMPALERARIERRKPQQQRLHA